MKIVENNAYGTGKAFPDWIGYPGILKEEEQERNPIIVLLSISSFICE